MESETAPSHDPIAGGDRPSIIQSVQTPLGFFVLVVLVVEALLTVVAVSSAGGAGRTLVIVAMIVLIFTLVAIVSYFAFNRPEALTGKRWRPTTSTQGAVPALDKIENARVLCASTTQFESLGFDQDIKLLEAAFGKGIDVIRGLSSDELRRRLTDTHPGYHLVHLLAYANPDTGAIAFGERDVMSAEAFRELVKSCEVRLIVLATCDSLLLAAKVARETNMIAAFSDMHFTEFVAWERAFYEMLSAGHALSQSYDVATLQTGADMVLLMQRDLALQGLN